MRPRSSASPTGATACPRRPSGSHLRPEPSSCAAPSALGRASLEWTVPFTPASTRYDTMQYNRVGRSGLLLPAISLGLWQNFGDDRPLETQRAIIRRAFDRGVTHFDLANNYGLPYGAAER